MDNVMLGIFWLCAALVIGVVAVGLFWVVDNAFTAHKFTNGKITDITFYPAHTQLIYNAALKMPMNQYFPDEWTVDVEADEGEGSIDIDEKPRKWINKGNKVRIEYARGRITGGFRVIDITELKAKK